MAVPVLAVLAVATFILAPKSPRPKETMQSAPPTPSLINKATPESGAPVPAYKDRLILPTGVWIPVKVDKDYAAVNGGELTPEGGIKLSHGVILLDAAHREFFARDVAVRVHLLSTEHTTASSLVVRQVGPRGRKLVFAPHFTQLSHYPTSREAWSAPVPHDESLGLDHPVTLEIAAIGSATYGLVDGKLMPPVLADEPSEKGSVLVGSLDGEFRDVEIMILDNIPAEKATLLAGVPRAAQALPNK
jgi:hypothetical protein